MIIQALKGLKLNLEEVKLILSSEFTNAEIVSSTAEGVTYIAVQSSSKLIFDIRITDNLIELYINLEVRPLNDMLKSIARLGLEVISKELNQLVEALNSAPKSLILSRVLPSKSIYVLLEPKDDFPPVKGVLSVNGLTVITPTCTVYGPEASCGSPKDMTIVKSVINILKTLNSYISDD